MVLTRENIADGFIQKMIRKADIGLRLMTKGEQAESVRRTLAAPAAHRTEDGGVWVFGYGSLIWNPCFHHAECRQARVWGYHRSFCLWTSLGRGSPDNPGLVLGLEPGGSVAGLAFRITGEHLGEELAIIWRREMVTAAYRPAWVTAHLDGRKVAAISFVIERGHERYARHLGQEDLIRTLATASGDLGSAAEYLFNTIVHLDELGVADTTLHGLGRKVAAHPAYRAPIP